MNLLDFPDEVLLQILEWTSVSALYNLKQVSTRLRRLAEITKVKIPHEEDYFHLSEEEIQRHLDLDLDATEMTIYVGAQNRDGRALTKMTKYVYKQLGIGQIDRDTNRYRLSLKHLEVKESPHASPLFPTDLGTIIDNLKPYTMTVKDCLIDLKTSPMLLMRERMVSYFRKLTLINCCFYDAKNDEISPMMASPLLDGISVPMKGPNIKVKLTMIDSDGTKLLVSMPMERTYVHDVELDMKDCFAALFGRKACLESIVLEWEYCGVMHVYMTKGKSKISEDASLLDYRGNEVLREIERKMALIDPCTIL